MMVYLQIRAEGERHAGHYIQYKQPERTSAWQCTVKKTTIIKESPKTGIVLSEKKSH
jgi:hypothetical protein